MELGFKKMYSTSLMIRASIYFRWNKVTSETELGQAYWNIWKELDNYFWVEKQISMEFESDYCVLQSELSLRDWFVYRV